MPQRHRQRRCNPVRTVRFADDAGLELFTVRVMREPSDVPPQLDAKLLKSLLINDDDYRETKRTWELAFAQPCIDYVHFRQTLEQQCVALESVRIRSDENRAAGTVKVKNVAFEKRVFIRYSADDWASFVDHPCVYHQVRRISSFLPSLPMQDRAGEQFDTFTFDFAIPHGQHERIAFCVCFTGADEEHWDSNDGRNYSLTSTQNNQSDGTDSALGQIRGCNLW